MVANFLFKDAFLVPVYFITWLEWSKAGELPSKVLCRCAFISSDQELWMIGGNITWFICSSNQVYVGRKV